MVRWVSRDGRWRVDQIELTLTDSGRDGWWYRVHQFGWYQGEARDWDGVAGLGVPLEDLHIGMDVQLAFGQAGSL